ncbi:MAG TPA: hypothetical protein VGM23_07305 [Armatimonadota bacterium]
MENESSVQAEISELTALRRQITIWRSSLFVVAVAIVVICILLLRGAVTSLSTPGEKQRQFASMLGTEMQQNIVPQLKDVGAEAIRRVDINKQIALLNKRAPDVANQGLKEARLLATNLSGRGQQVIKTEFQQALKAQSATLKREFPEATDAQLTQLMDNLVTESQNQVIDITGNLFTPHIDAMNSIIDDIAAIKTVEGPAASAQVPTWEMAFLLVDIIRAEYGPDPEPAKPAATTKSGKPAKTTAAGKEKGR